MLATDWRGHAGLNLLLTSLAALLLSAGDEFTNKLIIHSTILATLPDIDIRLEIPHRKYTHNLFFAVFAAIAAGLVAKELGQPFDLGFWSVIIAVTVHVIGDLMTYRGFNPLAPLGKKKYSLKLFKSSNKVVNMLFLLAGALTYYIYLVRFDLIPPFFPVQG